MNPEAVIISIYNEVEDDETEVRVFFYLDSQDFEVVQTVRVSDGEPIELTLDVADLKERVLDAVQEAEEELTAQHDDYWENKATEQVGVY